MFNYILNLFFPKKCIRCKREGTYLCEDCLSLIELNQINYCACFKKPVKYRLRCDNCPRNIKAVFTVLNEKQRLAQKVYYRAKKLAGLNVYFSYLITTYLKNISFELNNSFTICYENEVKGIAEDLSKFTKLPLNSDLKNVLLLMKKYPNQDILKQFENRNVYVISLFREIS